VQVKREEAANIKQDVRKVGFKSQDKSALYAKKNSMGSNLYSNQLVEFVGFFFSSQILPHFAKKIPWPDKKKLLISKKKKP